ncbi:hypothetical protein MMC32_000466 [Xylographa parallela]|nr:hypothetical protein [Xylographa parallela]
MQSLLKAIFTSLAVGTLALAVPVANDAGGEYNGGPSGSAFLIACGSFDTECRGSPYNYFCNQLGQMFHAQQSDDCDQNCRCAWV